MALTYPSQQPPDFRLLLDQGFPKPPGFAVQLVDRTVDVVHLHDLDQQLSMQSTPDWMLYCIAVESGFNALVARDRRQLDEILEMYVLSRLPNFSVITWRKGIEDPVREWGQLLAYLPEIKRSLEQIGSRAILLPVPTLHAENLHDPKNTLGEHAAAQGLSLKQIRDEALGEIHDSLHARGHEPTRFDELLL